MHKCHSLKIVYTLFFCFLITHITAQQAKDSIKTGEIKGVIKDTAYNFVLNNATLAVYNDLDSSLLQFTIPNNFGEFSIKLLPVDKLLRLIITHVGYRPFLKKFFIPKSTPVFDFGTISMLSKSEKDSATLDEVIVTAITPMRMNGDTLEFNADAFKLDSNATAEDLMRRLPGFTIWGDGEITFNGKKINSITVNGKPFMGGDLSVITQNLSKNSIDKVQVFNQKNETNPLDSNLNANIKLKKEVDRGHFGKISGGYGTDNRYAVDGMIGKFNKQMQLNIVGSANNINKIANDVNTLIKSSSFKGIGANIEYQPDFRKQGLNRAVFAGASFQYDFLPESNYINEERLNANYLLTNNHVSQTANRTTKEVLSTNSFQTQTTSNNNESRYTNQNVNATYTKNSRSIRLNINTDIGINNNESTNESFSEQERTGFGLVSTNQLISERNAKQHTYRMGLNFDKQDTDYYQKRRLANAYSIKYDIAIEDNKANSKRVSTFRSINNPSTNRDISRLYNNQDVLIVTNHFYMGYPGLKKLIFGNIRLADIQINIGSDFYLHNNNYNDLVLDLDTLSKQYKQNNYLTNKKDLDIINIQPAIRITKSFWKQLSNRYNKFLNLSIDAKMQHYTFQHNATQMVQNISYQYNKFIPLTTISYSNNQIGAYSTNTSLNYSTTIEYPQINQLAPLIDSSNALFLPIGNPNLLPQRQHQITLNYNYNAQSKNPLTFGINGSLGKRDNFITDSTIYNQNGSMNVYQVNLNGNQYLSMHGNIKKSFQKSKINTFQTSLTAFVSINKNPNFINNNYNLSRVINSNLKLNFNFSHKDLLTLFVEQSVGLYTSQQEGFDNKKFSNNNLATMVSGSLQLPKNLNWSSNITFNQSKAHNLDAVNFAIWNASISYRFLQGNRGEIKVQALDLLHQNKSIINLVSGNSQSFGYTNVLQQYYMITLSYYPRKFGR